MSTLSGQHLSTLCEGVQFNCAISDARFARDYSLCIYLLRMREFYRWRFNIPLLQKLNTETVGNWMSEMEAQWDDIEEMEFKPVIIGSTTCEPFDAEIINGLLEPCGLVYSAGIGRLGQPHFVLAELTNKSCDAKIVSYECGKELARDSINLPAMTQAQTIYIRHDSIKRHIWQMVDEWNLQKNEGPLARVVRHFDLNKPENFDSNIDNAVHQLGPIYTEHERGEVIAGYTLGERYQQALQKCVGSRNEFYLRAVRDLLADSLTTWPYLLKHRSNVALDFWFAGVSGARWELLKRSKALMSLQVDKLNPALMFDRFNALPKPEQQRWTFIAEQLVSECINSSEKVDLKELSFSLLNSTQIETT